MLSIFSKYSTLFVSNSDVRVHRAINTHTHTHTHTEFLKLLGQLYFDETERRRLLTVRSAS
jgi:hypothetical protein